MTGLSSFLGFAAFGAQGVLLGPLTICSATLMYSTIIFLGSGRQVRTRCASFACLSSTTCRSLLTYREGGSWFDWGSSGHVLLGGGVEVTATAWVEIAWNGMPVAMIG